MRPRSALDCPPGCAPPAANPASVQQAMPCLQAQDLLPQGVRPWRPLSLTLRRGEVLGLYAAPSAQGLSAWVRTLVGLQAPAGGRLSLLGQCTAELSERQLSALRQRVGFIPQVEGAGLFPAWSGQDNLLLAGPPPADGWLPQAQRLGVPVAWLQQPVAQRSSAQRHALAWWRVVHARPQCLVLTAWPWCRPGLEGLRWDLLWADLLSARPGVLVFSEEEPAAWPAPLRTALTRSGRFDQGDVQWA